MHVVFITSCLALSRSLAILRASVIKVCYISDTQAVDYLEPGHLGVEIEVASCAFKLLTGCHFEILLDFYRSYREGNLKSFDEILRRQHGQIGYTPNKLNMPCNHTLFRSISQEPLLNYMQFRELNVSREVKEDLVKSQHQRGA